MAESNLWIAAEKRLMIFFKQEAKNLFIVSSRLCYGDMIDVGWSVNRIYAKANVRRSNADYPPELYCQHTSRRFVRRNVTSVRAACIAWSVDVTLMKIYVKLLLATIGNSYSRRCWKKCVSIGYRFSLFFVSFVLYLSNNASQCKSLDNILYFPCILPFF